MKHDNDKTLLLQGKTGVRQMLMLLMVCIFLAVPSRMCRADEPDGGIVQETEVKEQLRQGWVKENGVRYYYVDGKMLKNTWQKINGAKYYFKGNGAAVTGSYKCGNTYYVFDKKGKLLQPSASSPVRVDGTTYFVTKKGKASPGWHIYKNALYYAKKNGKCYAGQTVDGITFTKRGYAVNNTNAMLKKLTMSLISKITSKKMSMDEKRLACWNYLLDKSRFSYYPKYPDQSAAYWQRSTAYNMLTTHSGNCYSFACAYAALLHELGDNAYVVVGTVFDGNSQSYTPHCWTKIGGKYYDPEAKYAGWADQYGTTVYGVRSQELKLIKF